MNRYDNYLADCILCSMSTCEGYLDLCCRTNVTTKEVNFLVCGVLRKQAVMESWPDIDSAVKAFDGRFPKSPD